ncbi:acyl-CoA synthetase FdrA [Hafnia paralvei]|uniref:acyl-CoA synthetase FdrA n=1 Tax=Hafnia paralvei TaxID=546367 RepID=UPI0010334A81|nr:acyl-CoA synthetase FdrA [Hafnia paralvei]TBM00859.1 acyl-CoA synthetase FdrA [Hafnia paralvei]
MYKVFNNMYQDSVSLMQISAQICKLAGITQASVVMGTETNLAQLQDAGFPDPIKASPNDLIIAVMGETEACEQALEIAHQRLNSKPEESGSASMRTIAVTSLQMAQEQNASVNLALISVPGDYAAAEALKALELNMNVMLFSDNVSLQQEKQIKLLAQDKNLLVMGPDCGTAIINGLPLGFANVVKSGCIGVVGASGTGLQEITCRIDQLGAGVSQAIGTGGHDLHEEIGGISMLFGLNALAQDENTHVIVLISKPPARHVAEKILRQAQTCGKPVVVNFLGAEPAELISFGIHSAETLADSADIAVALSQGKNSASTHLALTQSHLELLQQHAQHLSTTRKYIRGVFAGGTFCYESQLLCQKHGIFAYSNTPTHGNEKLNDIWRSNAHTLIDMGDDDFTRGRPHPMIDPTLRNQRIQAELDDPNCAVVLFDLVLGYGATMDPAQELLQLLNQRDPQNSPLLVAHVCGTEADPQTRSLQINALHQSGVLIAECNAQAALWASQIALIQAKKNGVTQ